VGIPLPFVGLAMCMFAFLGAFARYVSGEAAPVHKDTFNYLAQGTQGGVKTVATAVGQGLAAGMSKGRPAEVHCPSCHQANDTDAKFCKRCGTPIAG
jgi:hypothetical protein